MSPITVAGRLDAIRAEWRTIIATRCAACGHPASDHAGARHNGRCWEPRTGPGRPCRCRTYHDPADTLGVAG